MSVHYKFKAAIDYSTLPVDGMHISVEDLIEAIMDQKKLSRNHPFELEISDAENQKVFKDPKALIPKNTSVLVERKPMDKALFNQRKNKPSNSVASTEALLSNPANLINVRTTPCG